MLTKDEIADLQYFFSLPNHQQNWLRLKEWFWKPYNQRPFYINDSEHVLLIEHEGERLALGYLHAGRRPKFSKPTTLLDYINRVKEICTEYKWDNYKLIIATDFYLEHMFYDNLIKLPTTDIKYLVIETGSDRKPDGPFYQNISFQIKRSYERKYRYSFRRNNNTATDTEEDIMNALRNGDGDLYGL